MITIEQLKEKVDARKCATAVCIVTDTEPKMRKTNNPFFGRVRRIASRSGMLNASYENAVNRQRGRENHPEAGEFNASALWGGKGEHVSPAIVRHTGSGEEYLVFFPTRTTEDGKPIANQDLWLLDGQPVDGETLAAIMPFVVAPSAAPKQETEKQISWRTVKLENVKQVTMGGELLEVG